MNIYIYPNFSKRNAKECASEVIKLLLKNGDNVFVSPIYKIDFTKFQGLIYADLADCAKGMDFVVAIGGDGTILRCAKYLVKTDTKLVGVNTGRLGFMASIEYDELGKLKRLETGDYVISERFMTECLFNGRFLTTSLNDIVVSESHSKMCEFSVFCDNKTVGSYRADGIIFSTPTGSTAYALSAGGPVIHPELSCIEMNLICPHSLFARPIIFSAESQITLKANIRNDQSLYLTADGEQLGEVRQNDIITIKKSKHTIKLVDIEGNTFFDTLNTKLMHSLK